MITEASFDAARRLVLGEGEPRERTIGRLSEKSLHRILKHAIEPDAACHEVPLMGSVVDIFRPSGVVEIQTRGYDRLIPKLEKLLDHHPVTVVCPVPRIKTLHWVSGEGEVSAGRKSPKRGSVTTPIYDLYRIRRFLSHPNLTLCMAFLDVEEYALKNGTGFRGRRGRTRLERIPTALGPVQLFRRPADYLCMVPTTLAQPFTLKEYQKAIRQTGRHAYTVLRLLCALGVLCRDGMQGREYLYKTTEGAAP